MFNGQMAMFIGLEDGANHYTLKLESMLGYCTQPTGDLVSSWGVCLGPSNNNLIEYHAVIRLLTQSLDNDVREIRVYLDLELVVQ